MRFLCCLLLSAPAFVESERLTWAALIYRFIFLVKQYVTGKDAIQSSNDY